MKIEINNDGIEVRAWGLKKFSASASSITRLQAMGDYRWSPPKFLFSIYRPNPRFRFLLIDAGEKSITLDSFRDTGFDRVIDWLKRIDFDIDSVVTRATQTPLIRVTVPRVQRY